MKQALFCFLGAGLLLMTVLGCRRESDVLLAYDHNENLVFFGAETSFSEKFDIIWNGMNQYYALWDYEAEQGIDWDAVYDTYYPKFQALDERSADQGVTDEELKALLDEFLNPLHDGHFYMKVKNHVTGNTVIVQPAAVRIAARQESQTVRSTALHLGYYADPANGEVEMDDDGNPIVKLCDTRAISLITAKVATPGMGGQWLVARIRELEALPSLTEMQAYELEQMKQLVEGLKALAGKSAAEGLSFYNDLQARYAYLGVPGLDYIDPAFNAVGLEIKSALLKGNIAYLGFSSFCLGSYLNETDRGATFDMSNPLTQELVAQVGQVWQSWFDSIQTLHKAGSLGGVIIDLRGNGGGMMDDSQYAVGALVPGSDIHFGYQRFKRGSGRYDYSTMMEARVNAMQQPHEEITDVPVVVLVNCMSVSMSETSALCVRTLPRGTVIGKTSFGALCALCENEFHSLNYAGYIGVEDVTPVFGHVPSMASFTLKGEIIEAKGVTPDIEVDFDADLFQAGGRDTQLDRALQFIRTGQ